MRSLTISIIVVAILGSIGSCKEGVPASTMEAGKKVYTVNCSGCHMENGVGVPRMNPSLVNSPYVMGHPNGLIELVLKGSAFFGNTDRGYNNEMASFHSLTDDQIADMVTYVRNTFAKTGDVVKADDVKKVREGIK